MRRRKVLARIVRSAVERLEARMLLSSTLNEGVGSAIISGLVYNDLDGNGHLDLGEPAIPGTTVTLAQVGVNYNGAAFPTVQADVNGNFSFTGLAVGQYQLAINPPDPGFSADTPGQLLVTVSANDIVALNLGETTNVAGGGSGAATIQGTLFLDANANGVQDNNEGVLSGGDTVYLDLNGNGVADAGEPTTTTDNLGSYTFDVATGSYQVRAIPRQTFHQDGPGFLRVTVYSGDATSSDVGETDKTTITGTVFQDLNGNGLQDPGESPVAGETVFLNDSLNPNASTTTDSLGHYFLSGLFPGIHRVEIQSNSGFIQDGLGYVDVNVAAGLNTVVNLAEGAPSSVSGTVFNDRNGNGIQDSGDIGLTSQVVYVDLSNDGVLNDRTFPITAATEVGDIVAITSKAEVSVGDVVTIENLSPTQYNGMFTVLSVTSYGFTYQDYDPFTGIDYANLSPAVSFGAVVLPAVNVALGPDGLPLAHAEPSVESNVGNVATVPATPDGNYQINNLGPGTYTLRLQVPKGTSPTGPANASHSFTFTLGSGQILATQNFGLQGPDLTVAVLSLPTKPVLGGAPQRAVVRVTNVGSLPAFGTTDITLFSQTTNAVVNTQTASMIGQFSDVPIHLRPGQSRILSFIYSFPIQTPTNVYYVSAEVTSKTVEDDNAANNFAPPIGPISVATPVVDLSAAYFVQPAAVVDPGQPTTFSVIVTNLGNVASTGTVTLRVYLTQTPQLEPTDAVTQRFLFANVRIRPGHPRTFKVTLANPGPNLSARYILVAVDSGNPLGETNLANNVVTPVVATVFN